MNCNPTNNDKAMTEFPIYFTGPEEPQHHDSCQWKEDGDGIWNTGCGHLFEFTEDGPTENNFRFCYYCGGKISIADAA